MGGRCYFVGWSVEQRGSKRASKGQGTRQQEHRAQEVNKNQAETKGLERLAFVRKNEYMASRERHRDLHSNRHIAQVLRSTEDIGVVVDQQIQGRNILA